MLIGIDMGGTNIRVGLVRDGIIKKCAQSKISDKNSGEEMLDQICKLIDSVINSSVKGIGAGIPSIMEKGVVYEAFNLPGFQRFPLQKRLEAKYKVKVALNNDANCFTLGEARFGKGKGARSVAGVIIGTGFGVGFVDEGNILSGRNTSAGEFGRMPFLDRTVEDYCSGKFFLGKGTTSQECAVQARQGKRSAGRLFIEFGRNLGIALSMIVNAYDPEMIVIGGGLRKTYGLFLDEMNNSLEKMVYRRVYNHLKIRVSTRKYVAVLGASALV